MRKSDTLTGAVRNHLESLKSYLQENKQTTFTSSEIRRKLRLKESTLRNYNKQLLLEGYIKKVKAEKGKMYHYEIIDINEYDNLKDQINNALNTCIKAINLASS